MKAFVSFLFQEIFIFEHMFVSTVLNMLLSVLLNEPMKIYIYLVFFFFLSDVRGFDLLIGLKSNPLEGKFFRSLQLVSEQRIPKVPIYRGCVGFVV